MSDPSSCPPLSILLVEDHADTALAIRSFLTGMGHSVRVADSVEAAIKEVIAHQFEIIISDVGLPDGNGVSLIHGIRRFCKTPALALTGYSSDEDAARCMRAGFDMHLAKPVGPEKLQDVLKTLLAKAG